MVQEPNKPADRQGPDGPADTGDKRSGDQVNGAQSPGDGATAVEGQHGEPTSVAALKQELDAMKDKYLRALADCQNIQKRAMAERGEAVQRGQADMVRSLLPVLDNFERTLEAAKTATDVGSLTRGVRIICEQMLKVLGEFGLRKMEVNKGDPFDPVYQQAVAHQATDEVEPEHILHVAQAGYTMRDKMLRPAAVVVAKEPQESQDEQVNVDANL